MLNILCLLITSPTEQQAKRAASWYKIAHVNNLYEMCKRNISVPFKFYCMTGELDRTEFHSDIQFLHYPEYGFIDKSVYYKVSMFSEEVNQQLDNNQRVFFDLDVIIRKNIDDIVTYQNDDKVTLIKAMWRADTYDKGFPLYHHQLNSSCMTWKPSPKVTAIWNKFWSNPEYYLTKYRWGMDGYLAYEATNLSTFPEGLFYSHFYGVDWRLNDPDPVNTTDPTGMYRASRHADLVKDFPVVLLNGPVKEEPYNFFAQYYS